MKVPDYLVEACHHVLETARKDKGMTKMELAEKTGINDSYFRACTYKKRNISIGVLWRIAEALGVPVDTLVIRIMERRTFLQNFPQSLAEEIPDDKKWRSPRRSIKH